MSNFSASAVSTLDYQPSLLDSVECNDGKEVNDTMHALISVLDSKQAARLVVAEHYLHRRPPISHAFGIHVGGKLLGAASTGFSGVRPRRPDDLHGQANFVNRRPGLLQPVPGSTLAKTPRWPTATPALRQLPAKAAQRKQKVP